MEEMQEIIREFVDESGEVLNSVMADVIELENNLNSENVNKIFRAFHSMKGNARMLGFERLGAFGHKAEDVLALIRNGVLEVDKATIDILLRTLDMMNLILGDIRGGGSDNRDTATAIDSLESIMHKGLQLQKTIPAAHEKPQRTHDARAPLGLKKKTAQKVSDNDVIKESKVKAPVAAAAKGSAGGGIVLDMGEEPLKAAESRRAVRTRPNLGNINTDGANRSIQGRPLKIMIAEDDFTSRIILTKFLSEYGNCHIAKDGLEAIQAFTHAYEPSPPQPYDLICMDIMMPNIDGNVAVQTIRAIERGKGIEGTESETAIVFTSAVKDTATIIRACYECGANYYFVKPLDFKQMKHQMRKLGLIK